MRETMETLDFKIEALDMFMELARRENNYYALLKYQEEQKTYKDMKEKMEKESD